MGSISSIQFGQFQLCSSPLKMAVLSVSLLSFQAALRGGADGTYTVTLGTALAAQALTFNNSGYTLSGAQTLTLNNTGSTVVTIAAGKTATIDPGTTINFNSNSGTGQRTTLGNGSILNINGTWTKPITDGGTNPTNSGLGFQGPGTGNTATVNIGFTGTMFATATSTSGGIVIANAAGTRSSHSVN